MPRDRQPPTRSIAVAGVGRLYRAASRGTAKQTRARAGAGGWRHGDSNLGRPRPIFWGPRKIQQLGQKTVVCPRLLKGTLIGQSRSNAAVTPENGGLSPIIRPIIRWLKKRRRAMNGLKVQRGVEAPARLFAQVRLTAWEAMSLLATGAGNVCRHQRCVINV